MSHMGERRSSARYSETDTPVSDRHRRCSRPPQRRPLNTAVSIFTVTPDPNSIGAAWTFTGSDGYSHAGTGDGAPSDLVVGDYTMNRPKTSGDTIIKRSAWWRRAATGRSHC